MFSAFGLQITIDNNNKIIMGPQAKFFKFCIFQNFVKFKVLFIRNFVQLGILLIRKFVHSRLCSICDFFFDFCPIRVFVH